MPAENINEAFRLKKIDEIIIYLIEQINRNELMSKKYKNVCRILNKIDHLLIVISTNNRCITISAFASLVGIPIGVTSSEIRLKICAITAGIKKYSSIMKKKKKKHEEIALLVLLEVLIFITLIESNISHDEFVLIRWKNSMI